MSNDVFRITRGLEIDRGAQLLQGASVPGLTPDTDAAPMGSGYLNTADGLFYTKVTTGTGADVWVTPSFGHQLYNELATTPTYPHALGNNSIALGSGAQTSSGGVGSLAIGDGSLTHTQGSIAYANGSFLVPGDVQAGKYLLRTETTSNTGIEAFLNGTGGAQRLVLLDNSTWTFRATVTGHQTNGVGHAGYTVQGVVYRAAGAATTAIQGSVTKTVLAESNTPWDINITADTVNGALVATCQGQTGKTIRWAVLIETLEVTN